MIEGKGTGNCKSDFAFGELDLLVVLAYLFEEVLLQLKVAKRSVGLLYAR